MPLDRSSFQTTSTSPARNTRTQLSSPGRSARTPAACSATRCRSSDWEPSAFETRGRTVQTRNGRIPPAGVSFRLAEHVRRTAPSPACRKRPFTAQADRLRPRQQDGFQPDEELKDEDYFDIGSGSYDVEVKPGPQAGSRREEDLKMMGEFVAKLPPDYMMNFMDLVFELVDAPAGRKLSERANKLLPEGLRDEGEQGQQDPAQLQAKLQEVGEKFEKLQQEHQQAQQAIETKQVEAQAKAQLQQADLESKEGIAQAKLVVEWTKVMAQSDNEEAKNKAKAEVDRIFAERKGQGDSDPWQLSIAQPSPRGWTS